MASYLSLWWVWVCISLVLGVVELLAPAFIFLGFGLGALSMALVVVLFPTMTPSVMLALFAALSLLGWIALRVIFRRQSSGARVVSHDINDH